MNKDIMVCGVGGQGTVLASKIIAAAAMREGNTVHSAETIGMAQRGGSVTSHIRVGEQSYSPLVPPGSADIVIAFEPSEAVRNIAYLKAGGIAVVNTSPVRPVTESLHNTGYDGSEMVSFLKENCSCIFVDSDEVNEKLGSAKFFNVFLLGVLAGSGKSGIGKDSLTAEIKRFVPEKFIDVNLAAFEAGYEKGTEFNADK